LPDSPYPDDSDEELPPAEDEYPEERALKEEAIAAGLMLRSPAAAPIDGTAAAAASAGSSGSDNGLDAAPVTPAVPAASIADDA
jgi:Tfp pilus assembly major pilin PilA